MRVTKGQLQLLYELTANQGLILVAGGGLVWVIATVFMDQASGERDRNEYGFDLLELLRDLF